MSDNVKENKDQIIIIIRHGEKISDDEIDLSPRGKVRAECLPILFSEKGLKYVPTKLYANKRDEETTRSYDTIVPLSKALNLEIEEFDKRKPDEFAKNKLLKDNHDVILISTSTKRIPIITEILGHKIFVNGYDKYYIWKNGKFL